jgi:glucose/mannose-6-phosphate isomerase
MLGRILAFPTQLREALARARRGPELIPASSRPDRLWVVGMGGSAIGGDFLRAWALERSSLAVDVARGYDAPHALSAGSFAIFVSYSGNTEETLSIWEEAGRRGVPRAAVTSGGELGERAERAGAPVLTIPSGMPPRAALGWTSVPLLVGLARAGLAPFDDAEIEAAAAACERTIARSGPDAGGEPAVRAWARAAAEGLPLVYAPADRLAPAATRWACQLNENGKLFAHVALFPEQNHNEIVAWDARADLQRTVRAALLADDRTHARVRRRMALVARTIEERGGTVARFEPEGDGLLARLYSLAVLGDLASVYVAAARGIDPTPVVGIDRLKAELARAGEAES